MKQKTKIKDGDIFGDLTVIKYYTQIINGKSQGICDCICKCGNTCSFRASALKYDNKRQCGCKDGRGSRTKYKVGERFGKLIIIETWTEKFGKHSKEKVCKCKCDCGNIVITRVKNLRNKHKLSCGCLVKVNESGNKHPAWKGYGEISSCNWEKIKYGSVRRSRRLEFNLTIEQVWELFLKQNRKCAISGVDIAFSKKNPRHEEAKTNTASLDRIDSSKGYTIDNVQWVHKTVNMMKQSLLDKDFIKWCKIIAEFNK